jgi:succinate dehydrogenase / fumarate reductase, membrane anchor subunit
METRPSLRTPLGKVRGLGSARSGTEHFWRQRLTGLANIPLTIAFLLVILALQGNSHVGAIALLSSAPVAILMFVFIAVGAYHMKLGMQVIIEDYVHGEGLKIAALIANTAFAVLIAASSAYALFTIAFAADIAKG